MAESRWALPLTIVYALLVWTVADVTKADALGWQAVMVGVSTLLMALINNVHALLRIYSRMVSCSFLVMATATLPLFVEHWEVAVVQLSWVLFFICFLYTYQDRESTGWSFYAFLSLGVGVLVWPLLLLLVPLLWLLMGVRLMSLSPRTFFASLLGLTVPFWTVLCATPFFPTLDVKGRFLVSFTDSWKGVGQLSAHTTTDWLFLGMLTLLGGVGVVHFLRNAYQDKIRTRMIYELFIVLFFFTLIAAFLLPRQSNYLMALTTVTASTLVGHFVALTHTRWTNWVTIFFILLLITITACYIWNG